MLTFSRGLEALAGDPSLPKGLGSVNIYGGRFEANNQTRDLRDLYRCCFPVLCAVIGQFVMRIWIIQCSAAF